MKYLADILIENEMQLHAGDKSAEVTALTIDSRKAEPGCAYFAIKGTLNDGHQYIQQAIDNGAITIVFEDMPATLHPGINYIHANNSQIAVGKMADRFYDHPSSQMQVVGVTGTNGKTTIATLLYKLFTELGYKTGLISTVQNIIGQTVIESTHTTPDAIQLQWLLKEMKDAGCKYVFMEVSSHAIHQHRIKGITFTGAIFSNITHDHLDYHKTFDAYINAKKMFFDELPATAFALSNIDDKRGSVMLQNTKSKKYYYALKSHANFKGKVLENQIHGLLMDIDGVEVHFRISGLFNGYNLLAVYGTAILLQQQKAQVLQILSNLIGAEGRFETYRSAKEGVIGIIDYAHTPDALLNVLATIKQFDERGKIITVVGCGGDRDRKKRPVMTMVACEHSDQVIITSDNPRSEDPEMILDDMEVGLTASCRRHLMRITDRRQAIRVAVNMAQKNDIVLVAGKGHEKYQEIKGVKYPFDDVEILLNQYQELSK